MISYSKIEKLKKNIKNLFSKEKDVISFNFVGSSNVNKKISEISDIDLVLILEKLNIKKFIYFNKLIQKIDLNRLRLNKFKIKINNTFGPLKFSERNIIVIHLMIYDLKSHYQHTIKSPFTCYDWENSNNFYGIQLKNLYPVRKLQPMDFFKSRRTVANYISDLETNSITYRELKFIKNKLVQKKRYYKINDTLRVEYAYHIIKFLLHNDIKLEEGKNTQLIQKKIENKILFYSKNKKDFLINLKRYNVIRNIKLKKLEYTPTWVMNWTKKFIKQYDLIFKNKWNNSKSIYFIRHYKTKKNDGSFLGQNIDPDILKSEINKHNRNNINLNIDSVYSSKLLRSISTAKLFFPKKKLIIYDELNEIDYGEADGMKFDQFRKKYPSIIDKWYLKKDPRFPKGENSGDVLKRVKKMLKILSKTKKNKIAIITHNVFLKCLFTDIFNLKIQDAYKLNIEHGKVYEFKIFENKLYPNIDRELFSNVFSNLNHKI
tara:strand:- start:5160 stop:6623 length:1464 start_codon:yes stop_codon:yes gene_type:complete